MINDFNLFRDSIIQTFSDCDDFICRQGGKENSRFAMISFKGITSRDYVSDMLLRPLLNTDLKNFDGNFSNIIVNPSLIPISDANEAANMIIRGNVLILIESELGFFKIIANAEISTGRTVQEPGSDITIRGPKAGFVEDAEKNIAMLRRYIRTPSLKLLKFVVGDISQTNVFIAYIDDRVDKKLVEAVSTKLTNAKANVITDSTNIAMILDEGKGKSSLLPNCGSSEKVDKVASKLMAGRVAIIVDGSPFVLTLPFLFIEGLQAADDYLHTPFYATFIRLLRFISFISAIFAPAILCAVINSNPEIMPNELYGLISESRRDIPVSFFWEIVVVLTLFETLREVGVRMPRTVGDAVGIVGSIILGNTAVEAGLVSSVGVITVAFSAVCAFITPAYMYVIVLSRIVVLIIAELFGVVGLVSSVIVLFLLLCLKKSFGVPYMTPLIPFDAKGMQDTLLCLPKKILGRNETFEK